jgi:hypothetical protein
MSTFTVRNEDLEDGLRGIQTENEREEYMNASLCGFALGE